MKKNVITKIFEDAIKAGYAGGICFEIDEMVPEFYRLLDEAYKQEGRWLLNRLSPSAIKLIDEAIKKENS